MIILLIVTLTSMLVAAVMSTIAWRIAGDERRRSEVRVAALAAEIHEDIAAPVLVPAQTGASRRAAFDLPLRPVQALAVGAELAPHRIPRSADLFVQAPPRSTVRMFAVLAGGGVVFAVAVAMAILVPARLGRQSSAVPTPAIAPATRPLELVALEHERVGDQLTVRGVVRNPAAGVDMDRLTAVVILLSPDGALVETGRATVDASALKAGGESAFAVTVPRAGDVGRYRVSFRTDDQVVSHVDRRHEPS